MILSPTDLIRNTLIERIETSQETCETRRREEKKFA